MKKTKFILPIVLAFSANAAIAGDEDDLHQTQLKSCFKSQGREDNPKKSIRIVSPDGEDLTPKKIGDGTHFDTISVPELGSDHLTARLKIRERLLARLEVPDMEWEFAISTLSHVLGLSDEISPRHEQSTINDFREVNLLLDALEIIFEISISDKNIHSFGRKFNAYQDRIRTQMNSTLYYHYLASHQLFEEKTTNPVPPLEPAQLKMRNNYRKLICQATDLDHLNESAIRALRLLKGIVKKGTLGDQEKRKAILDHLRDCYHNNMQPQVLFTDVSEEDKQILNRFLIAVKERLLRFITPEEAQAIEAYARVFQIDSSSESEEESSTDSDSDSDEYII